MKMKKGPRLSDVLNLYIDSNLDLVGSRYFTLYRYVLYSINILHITLIDSRQYESQFCTCFHYGRRDLVPRVTYLNRADMNRYDHVLIGIPMYDKQYMYNYVHICRTPYIFK